MKKRGQVPTGATMILVLITVIVIVFWAGPAIADNVKPFFILFGVGGEEENGKIIAKDPAELAFNSFLFEYKDCKEKYKSDDCLCGSFDTTEIPDGYSIKLEDLNEKGVRIGLFGKKPTAQKQEVMTGDNLCFYKYDKSKNSFYKSDADGILLDPAKSYNEYTFNKNIQLFKVDSSNICFVEKTSDREGFVGITRQSIKCYLKDKQTPEEKIKLALLDLELSSSLGEFDGEQKASEIIDQLEKYLKNIGKVSKITKEFASVSVISERRTSWFNSLYNREGGDEKSIKDKVYLLSVAAKYKVLKESDIKQDHIILHYIKGSAKSKLLAEKIKKQLDGAYGKLYKDGKEYPKAEADEKYRFNTKTVYEANDASKKGPVFLLYTKGDYDTTKPPWIYSWKEKEEIPAVFIEGVEVDGDGYYLFTGHYELIAEKIYEGVKDYFGTKEKN